ncbi:hypothetical protein ACFOOP_02040 [Marinicaulis aureus]|uniref:Uncharacterized protein n=1 Tax=Hyphococcus aureus TaxID=2666033 RepID=A0ABW1KXX3_9PROT
MTTRIEKLQDAIKDYGAAAFENLLRCKGFGEAVVNGLPEFLGCSSDCVTAVPPEGPFDPSKDYGEDAFSYRHREVIVLEPVQFGLALTMKNMEDSGALWLRTALSVEVTGDSFDVFVAQQPIIHIPLDYSDKLEPVFEAIYREFLNTFQLEVLEFNDKRFETRIGFVPEKEKQGSS